MPEPMQYPTPTLDDSHRLIRERAGFASLADMRKHIEAQNAEIERLMLRIDNALRILSGENSWLALVMAAKEELEKARGGF